MLESRAEAKLREKPLATFAVQTPFPNLSFFSATLLSLTFIIIQICFLEVVDVVKGDDILARLSYHLYCGCDVFVVLQTHQNPGFCSDGPVRAETDFQPNLLVNFQAHPGASPHWMLW